MSDELFEDPISPSVQDLVTIFKNDLASVTFPDVSLETLESLATKVRSASKELGAALKQADAAREALEAGQSELQAKAVRGLAYAKVFAEGNDALLEKLSEITLGKAGRSPKKNVAEKPKVEKVNEVTPDSQKAEEKKSTRGSKKSAEAQAE